MNTKIYCSFLIILTFSACTRTFENNSRPTLTSTFSSAPSNLQAASPLPGDSLELPALIPFTPVWQLIPGASSNSYAVILVPENEVLNIYNEPGEGFPIAGNLQAGQAGLRLTGGSSNLGEELWVEIQISGGGVGWVNAEYITDSIPGSVFCQDPQVQTLLGNFESAILASDAESFGSLVSPAHGLDLVYLRDGIVANYSPEEASWAFLSTYEVEWGLAAGSGQPVIGTFSEIILPSLQDVFKNLNLTCNEVVLGGATYLVQWPQKYFSINFFSLHNPGSDEFEGLDWSTWLAGVEYLNGQPYLLALLNFQWEP